MTDSKTGFSRPATGPRRVFTELIPLLKRIKDGSEIFLELFYELTRQNHWLAIGLVWQKLNIAIASLL